MSCVSNVSHPPYIIPLLVAAKRMNIERRRNNKRERGIKKVGAARHVTHQQRRPNGWRHLLNSTVHNKHLGTLRGMKSQGFRLYLPFQPLLLIFYLFTHSFLPLQSMLSRSALKGSRYLLTTQRRTEGSSRYRLVSFQSEARANIALPSATLDRVGTLKSHIGTLPKCPGIYIFRDQNGVILYIGKSVNLLSRVKSYFNLKSDSLLPAVSLSTRIKHMTQLAHTVEHTVTETAIDALVLEDSLIRAHQPPFNVLLKDDKRYPYVCITYSDFYPKIFVAKKKLPPKQTTPTGLQDVYIGPFVDGHKIKELMRTLKEIFLVQQRSIPLYKDKPCLNYHIGRCPGVCQQLITSKEYLKTIDKVRKIFEGNGDLVVKEYNKKMKKAAKEEKFEEAAQLRDTSKVLSEVIQGSQLHFSSLSSALSNEDIIDVIGLSLSNTMPKYLVIQIVKIRNGRISSRIGYTQSLCDEEMNEMNLQDVETANDHGSIGELVQKCLESYYSNPSSEVPTTLILPIQLPDSEMLKCLLREKSGENNHRSKSHKKGTNATETIQDDVNIRLATDAGENHLTAYADQLAQKEAASVDSDTEKIRNGLEGLAEMLELSMVPGIIEGYDISHSQGTNTVASKVVFVDGKPVTSLYRRYKLKNLQITDGKVDDYLAIKEILSRRFADYLNEDNSTPKEDIRKNAKKIKKDKIPDIILIDGGKGQLGVAEEVLSGLNFNGGNSTTILSLAKKNEEVFMVGKSGIINADYDNSSPPMRILRQVRDEAHRYALAYHSSLRKKSFLRHDDNVNASS